MKGEVGARVESEEAEPVRQKSSTQVFRERGWFDNVWPVCAGSGAVPSVRLLLG